MRALTVDMETYLAYTLPLVQMEFAVYIILQNHKNRPETSCHDLYS